MTRPLFHRLPDSPSVAVVTPIFDAKLGTDEETALRHLERYLAGFDRYFVCPESFAPRREGFEVRRFPDPFFASTASYSRLLLSVDFYRAFAPYDYVLVYQLDCLVFSDALLDWCRRGYDYLGAPWLVDPEDPEKGFSRVGNGGLSLRRIASFLRTLESRKAIPFWRNLLRAPLPDLLRRQWLKRLRVLRNARRGVSWYAGRYTLNEDRFWSDRAALFFPAFRVAPVETALGFSFERAPRYCFERNGRRLPFGCHAWNRWDRAFWEPYLLG